MPRRIGYAKPMYREKSAKTSARGYGADWRKVRLQAMQRANWLCEDCLAKGIVRPATDGHHVEKITDAPEKRLDVGNVRCLCKACHDAYD